jgi:hypothetical protein
MVGITEIGYGTCVGFIDKLSGGVGSRRGRPIKEIHAGDVLDFWRVLYANKREGKLVLFAEMKLPGETVWNLKSSTTFVSIRYF